ncbi:hypothetical protein PISL3812_07015 [Talaromyces islandicus]|uniref:Mannosyltransferase n=1 Tax=Talaromyces islandicus TaxID=28573 RepID=A0A0U1M341_TALIS|nr:hypothetical protein PISL3812_07015 [Talaromyces islandicus]
MHLTASVRKFRRYIIGTIAFVTFLAVYFRESWYLSSGDRAINRMNLSMKQPPATDPNNARANAAIISLVRNSELDGMLASMRQFESSFNARYSYPWVFFNNEPFSDEFKERTQAATSGSCSYEIIPKEHWDVPDWIDQSRLEQAFKDMDDKWVKHGSQLSYHKMCRWFSGFFFRHPALDNFKYYWRVEPDVKFFCDIEYDVFRFMETHNKTYGFTINVYDDPNTLPNLWPSTTAFLDQHPNYLHSDNSLTWLTDSTSRPKHTQTANGYSTCHFWSNFEVGDLDFWRSPAYTSYFDWLDQTGGFFYERWGDAPVHSVALGLFAANEQIHWFRDIGYQHSVFSNCPDDDKCHGCQKNKLTPLTYWLNSEDCRPGWFKQVCESRQRTGGMDDEAEEMCRQSHGF